MKDKTRLFLFFSVSFVFNMATGFAHPVTGEKMEFELDPPEIYPWDCF